MIEHTCHVLVVASFTKATGVRNLAVLVVVAGLVGCAVKAGIPDSSIATRPVTPALSEIPRKWVASASASAGGLVYDDGTCSQDVEFELTRTHETLNGWVVSAAVVRGDCQPILSQEQRTQALHPSPVVGTLKGSIVSVAIFQVRTNNGVPNRIIAFMLSGTIEGDELVTSGTVVGPRTWVDINRDGVPDCDFAIPTRTRSVAW